MTYSRFQWIVSTFVLLFFALCQSAVGQTPCQLFTKADAEALFQRPVNDPSSRTTAMPNGNLCRYTFSHAGGTHGVTVRISTSQEIAEEQFFESAQDIMDRQKQTREKHDYASKGFKVLSNLGDDAFWNGTDLWLLNGDILAIITVNSVLEGSFPDMDTMNKAVEDKNLALSLEVAETILSFLQ